jgi:TatD DNase family protein
LIELADTHAHLQESEFEGDRDEVIGRARDAGVSTITVPAVDLATARAAIELAERHAGVFATVGCHPHQASELTADDIEEMRGLLSHPSVVAVGEIGLDFFRMHSSREVQVGVLEQMLAMAEDAEMPVVIHCRDAWGDLAPILEPWARRVMPACGGQPLGVLHYFSSDLETARRYIDLGFLVSVHTSVTHPKAGQLREVAAGLPLESLVVETDSPYGAPQAHRGRRNEPAYAVEAAKAIAAAKGLSVENVAMVTTRNARRLFRLDGSGTAEQRRDVASAPSEIRPGSQMSGRSLDGPKGSSLRQGQGKGSSRSLDGPKGSSLRGGDGVSTVGRC